MDIQTLSEDEVRTKVVNEWLKDCGVSDDQIRIEYSINLRLGKGKKRIHSRSDILVRNADGNNLLIIELKSPSHKLHDLDKHQAISYARSLADGGIAPFTILTNLIDVQIYDSVTGAIVGSSVPPEHPVVRNNFIVSGDALLARAEALEYLISLSRDNLMAFCQGQVDFRMKLLRNDDPWSEKKYIPQLYVNRAIAEKDLESKLFDPAKNKDIVLVVGPPQHGKTCLMCYAVEQFLIKGVPVLFYPAIALEKGLLTEIQEDFEWAYGENLSPVQVVSRLVRVIGQVGSPLVIVVDGWNELRDNAIRINNELQRLENKNIKVVLSTTSPSLGKLLIDDADNLSYVAESTKLRNSLIKRLSSEPILNSEEVDIVQIGNFSASELNEGKERYGKIFNVKFSADSDLPYDPFYLRIAAEQYAGATVPHFATLTKLINDSLVRKARRRNIREIELFNGLNKLAKIILEHDAPFASTLLTEDLSSDATFTAWTESGILQSVTNGQVPYIDFYLTHHKSYAIAIVHRKWHESLFSGDDAQIRAEMDLALKTVAGQTALSWFLSAPEHVDAFKIIFSSGNYFDTIEPSHLKIFSDAIANQVNFNENLNFDWLDVYIDKLYLSPAEHAENIEEITILIYSLIMSLDKVRQRETFEFWMRILLKIDNIKELGVEESYIHKVYGDDIKSDDGYGTFYDSDFDLELFETFAYDDDTEVAEKAMVFMAHAAPYYLLDQLLELIKYHGEKRAKEEVEQLIFQPICTILNELRDSYFGGMCPGWFTDAEPGDEEAAAEFLKQKENWFPILKFVGSDTELHAEITRLLKDLSEYVLDENIGESSTDPKQSKLDF